MLLICYAFRLLPATKKINPVKYDDIVDDDHREKSPY